MELVELKTKQRQQTPMTTSLKVAEAFGKEHKNVLRDIQNIGCSADFNKLNFALIKYTDARGRQKPAHQTRNR